MNFLQGYVANLTDDEKVKIIRSYEQFELDGFIGDAPIRSHTTAVLDKMGISKDHITMWMQQLAFECYRHFANAHLDA
jgi:hypothetical protein